MRVADVVSDPASSNEPLTYPASSSEKFSSSCARTRSTQKQGLAVLFLIAFFTFSQWPTYSSLSFSCNSFAYFRRGSAKSGNERSIGKRSTSLAVVSPMSSENFSKPCSGVRGTIDSRGSTYRVELFQLGVVDACSAEPEDHLRGQRVGVTTNVVDEEIWALQEADKHGLVL